MNGSHESLTEITAKVVAAFVSNNHVAAGDIPEIIGLVFDGFRTIGKPVDLSSETPNPAVSIRKSVTPGYIVCLEDGKTLKMLKRHLRTTYDMSPEEYRAKRGLPPDYPMVAPNYAAERSAMAVKIGLGRKRVAEPAAGPVTARKPGRAKKAA